jgi:hypothetical protein
LVRIDEELHSLFFPALDDRIGLKLLATRTFGSGVGYLRSRQARIRGRTMIATDTTRIGEEAA